MKPIVVKCWAAFVPGKRQTVIGFWKTKAAALCQSERVHQVKIAVEIMDKPKDLFDA